MQNFLKIIALNSIVRESIYIAAHSPYNKKENLSLNNLL